MSQHSSGGPRAVPGSRLEPHDPTIPQWAKIGRQIPAYMNQAAGWLFLFMAIVISVNAVTRHFGWSKIPVVELSSYGLAVGLSWSYAYALISRGHIRVDAVVMKLPKRWRVAFHILALAVLGGVVGLLGVRGWDVVSQSWTRSTTDNSTWTIPLVVPQALWLFGILMLLISVSLMLLHALRLVGTGDLNGVEKLLAVNSESEEAERAVEAAKSGTEQESSADGVKA